MAPVTVRIVEEFLCTYREHGMSCGTFYKWRAKFGGLAYKLIEEAEKSWCKIRGAGKIELLLKGIPFKDGEPVQGDQPVQQKLAA